MAICQRDGLVEKLSLQKTDSDRPSVRAYEDRLNAIFSRTTSCRSKTDTQKMCGQQYDRSRALRGSVEQLCCLRPSCSKRPRRHLFGPFRVVIGGPRLEYNRGPARAA